MNIFEKFVLLVLLFLYKYLVKSVFIFRFNYKQINVLITSKLLEEVEIQTCNYVVSYDSPKHFHSYVQSKCKVSNKKGNFIILVPNVLTFKKVHQDYVKMEDQIYEVCLFNEFIKLYF